jgi:hypothetical protein
MVTRIPPLIASALMFAAHPAAAASLIDGFEGETAGGSILDYASFANWTVGEDGTVDLVRSGEFGITCRSGNYCVDLDGTTGGAGALILTTPFAYEAGDIVTVSWWASGNQRGGANDGLGTLLTLGDDVSILDVVVTIGDTDIPVGDLTVDALFFEDGFAPTTPFRRYGWRFTAVADGSLELVFQDQGDDNWGVILDDVSFTAAPIPEAVTWAMLIAGFGLVGATARRRRLAA